MKLNAIVVIETTGGGIVGSVETFSKDAEGEREAYEYFAEKIRDQWMATDGKLTGTDEFIRAQFDNAGYDDGESYNLYVERT